MKEHPIPFRAPMVQAILACRKSQTRRTVKYASPELIDSDGWPLTDLSDSGAGEVRAACPYGQPGDHLWVKEAWQYADWTDDGYPWVRYAADSQKLLHESIPPNWSERLNDTWAHLSHAENYGIDNCAADRRMRSSRFMPRWASRITLEITSVRVERLQDISDQDCMAEGITDMVFPMRNGLSIPRNSYADLWESINGPGSWDKNPLVWVIEFRSVDPHA